MRGKNTMTLTYRGPDLKERAETRKLAGCTPRFCANEIKAGRVKDDTHISCDEVSAAFFLTYSIEVSQLNVS
jgi:hypothetical protein